MKTTNSIPYRIINNTKNIFFYHPELGSKEMKRSFLLSVLAISLINSIAVFLFFSNVQITTSYPLSEDQIRLILVVFKVVSLIYSFFTFPILLMYFSLLYYLTLIVLNVEKINFKEVFQQVSISYIFILVTLVVNVALTLLNPPSPLVNLDNISPNTFVLMFQEQQNFPFNTIKQIFEKLILLWINIVIINSFSKQYHLTFSKSIVCLIVVQSIIIIPDIMTLLAPTSDCINC